jgi:hypothetical protein
LFESTARARALIGSETIGLGVNALQIAHPHQALLHFDGAAHGVDDAAELDDAAVAGTFDDASLMNRDGEIDQIATQRPQPRQDAILVRASKPSVVDDVGDQDRPQTL